MSWRRRRPAIAVPPGERVLAAAESGDGGVAAGTRAAFYWSAAGAAPTRVAWEQVQAADWDPDESLLRVTEVGSWGEPRVVHRVPLDDPRDLLQLVRERVTASIVVQRHVPVAGRRGLRVIGRRAPVGDAPVDWFLEYDEGVDPDDPPVRRAAAAALDQARADTGL